MDDLLGMLLARQREQPAVLRFSTAHARGEVTGPRWRDRIPLTAPGPGEQYAFEVDLDACTGCKACVAACHNLNGLAPGESWRAVGALHGGSAAAPFVQTVTAACHHCLEPACQKGCPVDAYQKDPVTGIVEHLDDQCIGCRYCTLTCPYEVPRFDRARGIVRKCDMCQQRLAVGEAPACVQACPNGAITITRVKRELVLADHEAGGFVPGAPDPVLTQPTTAYRSARPIPRNALPADYYAVRPAHGHLALVAMLVGTQLAVGALAAAGMVRFAAVCAALAMIASLAHLGRPHLAHRALRGLGHSWLSREIAAFGGFAALTAGAVVIPALATPAEIAGGLAVFTSVMVYADTGRPLWRADLVALRFFGTAALLGLACAAHWPATLAVAAAKLALELVLLGRVRDRQHGPFKRSATLLLGRLRALFAVRLLGLVAGALLVPVLLPAAVALLFAGELLERHLFFVAAASPRMPGGLA